MKEKYMKLYRQKYVILCLIVIICLGVFLRLLFVSSLPNKELDSDERDYIHSAEALITEFSFDKTVYYHVPPVVPVVYSILFLFHEPDYQIVRYFQCFLFILTALIYYLLGKEVYSEIAGLCCAFIGAVYPYYIFFTGYATTETIACIVIPAVILACLKSVKEPKGTNFILTGILLALATLTRAAVIYFIVFIPLIYIFRWGMKNMICLKGSLFTILAFLILYIPWMVVNYSYFNKIVLTPTIGSGIMFYQTALRITIPDDEERMNFIKKEIFPKYYYPPGAGHVERYEGDQILAAKGKEEILKNLDKYPPIMWINFKRFWQFYPHSSKGQDEVTFRKYAGLLSYGLLFPFFLIGLIFGVKKISHFSVLYLFITYYTLVHTVLYGKLRYRIPMDQIVITFAVIGIFHLLEYYKPRLKERINSPNNSFDYSER